MNTAEEVRELRRLLWLVCDLAREGHAEARALGAGGGAIARARLARIVELTEPYGAVRRELALVAVPTGGQS